MKTFGIDVSPAGRSQKTGTEWYTARLVEAMQKQVKTDEKLLLYGPFLPSAPLLFKEGSGVVENHVLRWLFKRLWTQGRLAFEMLRRPPDVLFVPSHVVPWIHPKKTVTTIHDIGFKRRPDLYEPKARRYLDATTKFAIKQCVKLLTPSVFTKQELIDVYHVDPERIVVTPLAPANSLPSFILPSFQGGDQGVVSGDVPPPLPLLREVGRARMDVLKKHQLSASYFLTVSRMESKKNIATLIRGFEIFKERRGVGDPFQLVLVGKPGFGYSAIKTLIDRSPVKHAIRKLGWINDEDVASLMSGAFAYAYPSWYEGLGISALEASAAGTPVIASDIPALHEAAGDAALYFNPADPRALANQMTRLVEEGATRERLIMNARAHITEFSWDKTAALTWEVLRSL